MVASMLCGSALRNVRSVRTMARPPSTRASMAVLTSGMGRPEVLSHAPSLNFASGSVEASNRVCIVFSFVIQGGKHLEQHVVDAPGGVRRRNRAVETREV